MLALVLDAFYDRTRGWRNTRYERRRTVRTHAICPDCGQTWRLTLERTDGRERYLNQRES